VGKVPFKGKTQDETFEIIKDCNLEIPSTVPEVAKDLLQKILKKEPENRLGAQNINDLMAHPFFEGVNFETINEEFPPEKLLLNPQQ